jgi:uncharacterized protein YodC (DUF2158 family)
MIESLTGAVTFEPGDVVTLKSGGPTMTVIGVKEDGVQCMWYAEASDEVKTAGVPAICVEKATAFDMRMRMRKTTRRGKPKKHGKRSVTTTIEGSPPADHRVARDHHNYEMPISAGGRAQSGICARWRRRSRSRLA